MVYNLWKNVIAGEDQPGGALCPRRAAPSWRAQCVEARLRYGRVLGPRPRGRDSQPKDG